MTKPTLNLTNTELAGLKVLQRHPVEDSRGFFCRLFCSEDLYSAGMHKPIAQINHTLTKSAGTVRGLHFQYPPHCENKIVNCLRGEVFDVAVDLRTDSPTFLRWHAEVLTASNFKSLLIPEGFAHGFQTLCTDCELIYLHTESYHPESEGALNIADPRLAITWPLEITLISDRDLLHPSVEQYFRGILP